MSNCIPSLEASFLLFIMFDMCVYQCPSELRRSLEAKEKELAELNRISAEQKLGIKDLNETLGASVQSGVEANEIINRASENILLLKEIKDGMGSTSKRGVEGKRWLNRNMSHIAPDVALSKPIQQGNWANLPPELLLD
ncbi:unnamed protein product [Fraxinus pennsylvanica]|uniref:Uncharacterized protein n=1 Tax=Fraxinus pennsylvanica TaxID=56036 RepID=A0AAD1YKE8_9LAMI|nr:unnamed protein product [Fraxinus pennsylvanica]